MERTPVLREQVACQLTQGWGLALKLLECQLARRMLRKLCLTVGEWQETCFTVGVTQALGQVDLLALGGKNTPRSAELTDDRTKGKNMEELIAAVAEIRRERTVRATVYHRLVENGKLTQAEADRRAAALSWAEAYLRKLMVHWHAVQALDAKRTPEPPPITD